MRSTFYALNVQHCGNLFGTVRQREPQVNVSHRNAHVIPSENFDIPDFRIYSFSLNSIFTLVTFTLNAME